MKAACLLLFAVAFGAVPSAASAADAAPDAAASAARFSIGALRVTPTIALTNAGVDNNVFNEADVNHPKSDLTATVTPAADLWMRLGRSWLTGSVKEDLVYYRTYATERSVNGSYKGAFRLPFNRLTLKAGGGFLSTRDRPGFEIDARSQHTESDVDGALEVRAYGKTFLAATVRRGTVDFDRAAVFMGTNLQTALNRSMTSVGVTVRHDITAVTSVTVDVERQQDRFALSPERDSDSTRVMAGVRFGARIGGSAAFGYQQFTPLSAAVPDYRGLNASVDMGVAVVGGTHVAIHVIRDIEYSYDFEQPYYVATGTMLSIAHELFGPVDGTVRGGVQQLAYRGRLDNTVRSDRADLVTTWGGGIGYRVAQGMRIGFNLDEQRRSSDLAGHGYGGLRFGTAVTYGF